ncbi:radical S-adenosyl methionine domain-containing protein 2 [Decorospora gaudefroyi]|uniref:Radical S-adenosyl methionine domain-containing protein 2 n=1 Tax=Decorospora gaudefroyi TaxID=184978 RepID=A0A6A5KN16_9PLEO|nr:radical S-adenosyl methionine domain-containing protein 2 [Decorospora gaudefroyi]
MVILSLRFLAEVPILYYLLGIMLCAIFVNTGFYLHFESRPINNPVEDTSEALDPDEDTSKALSQGADASKSLIVSDDPSKLPDAPVSVNYFPSRECNYACGFCFHTATTSYVLPIAEAMRGLRLLKEAGMRKLNIAGGEPFLHPKLLTQLLRYCKEELGVESTSIVSNGSKIREKWMRDNCQWLDILAISCDSFNPETNINIGRGDDGKNTDRLFRIAEWCRTYGVKFKLNTVVNVYNWNEDMVDNIEKLAPFRWKVFQCLIVAGENDDETRKRDARKFLVSDAQWRTFCEWHKHLPCFVPEDNNCMASSYLHLDEYMCFLDKGEGMITQSQSILEVGVKAAMQEIVWDKKSFLERGGIYDWGRSDMKNVQQSACGSVNKSGSVQNMGKKGACDGVNRKDIDF